MVPWAAKMIYAYIGSQNSAGTNGHKLSIRVLQLDSSIHKLIDRGDDMVLSSSN